MKKLFILLCFVLAGMSVNAQSSNTTALLKEAKIYTSANLQDAEAQKLVSKGIVNKEFNEYFSKVSSNYAKILQKSNRTPANKAQIADMVKKHYAKKNN